MVEAGPHTLEPPLEAMLSAVQMVVPVVSCRMSLIVGEPTQIEAPPSVPRMMGLVFCVAPLESV